MMKSSGKSFLLFFAFLTFSGVFCRLTQKPKDVEAIVGSTAFFNCSSDNSSGPEIYWFHHRVGEPKERQYVYAWKELQVQYKERGFRMEIDLTNGTFNLVIPKVEASDAGKYVCWENEEKGERNEAELVVIESDPICDSSINLDQLIGENSCGMTPDAVELKCNPLKFQGNLAPRLKWKRADRPNEEAPAQSRDNSTGVASMTLTASVGLSGVSFVCEAEHSVSPGLIRCNSSVATVLHAQENRTEIHVDQNADVLCEANTNCQSCSYAWYDDRNQQVSSTKNMTARRLGSHQCKAKCRMRNKDCEIVAKQIYVNPPPPPTPSPPGGQSLWLLMLLVFIVIIAAIIIAAYVHHKKHKEKINHQFVKLKKKLYKKNSELISYSDNPTQIHMIRGKSSSPNDRQPLQCKIRGVTVHGKSVFVVYSKTSEIQEYDSESYVEKRSFDIPDLVDPWDIASSPSRDCLYVMDGKKEQDIKEILRIDSNGNVEHSWKTKKDAGYLSVTANKGNVILTVFKKNLFKEFSPEGILLWTIRVSAIHPHHALKIVNGSDSESDDSDDSDSGHYLLIHGVGDSLHRVCIVDKKSNTIKDFGERKGSGEAQMNLPKYLAVDRSGSVMVLDQNNNRVLLLNFDLGFQKVLIAPDKGLVNPSKIHLDETRGRLLIAEYDHIRVFSVLQVGPSHGPLHMV